MPNRSLVVRVLRVICLAPVLACVLAGGAAHADQTNVALGPLFAQLQASAQPDERAQIEHQIWELWSQSGRAEVDQAFALGARAMAAGEFKLAVEWFGRVVELAPTFAEGWNKRATAHYLASNLDESVRDIQKTLALEPRHFGALAGMGLIFMQRGDLAGALLAFEQVLVVHPYSASAQVHVRELRARLGRGAA